MAVLGLRFCARAFSSCGKWGTLFIVVCRPLTVVASLVVEHRLQTHRLSNCGTWAQSLRGVWDLPRPGLKPMSPALAGRFSTTAPPGKPNNYLLNISLSHYFSFTRLWNFQLGVCQIQTLSVYSASCVTIKVQSHHGLCALKKNSLNVYPPHWFPTFTTVLASKDF